MLRVKAAITTSEYNMPRKKIVVNLAPADIRKEGSSYDLAIAIGILAASGQVQSEVLEKCVILGEVSLDDGLQSVKGALPIAIQAGKEGFEGIIIPKQST